MTTGSRLAPRYYRIRPTVMAELSRSSQAFARQGRAIIDLSHGHLPGEMSRDFRQVAMDSWRDGHFTYLGGPGLPALRDAIVDWLDMREGRTAEDVLVSPGSRAALSAVLSVITGPGDVVLVDAAAWMIFHQIVSVSGATPVPCVPGPGAETRHLKLTADDVRLQLEMMPGVRALVMANPVNPTAQVYDAEELMGIVEVCAAAGVFCIIDRLYGTLIYDGARFPYLQGTPAVRDWCIVTDGVARAFRGMGGLRVGWACGPRDIVEAATHAQDHGPGPPGRVPQRVALSALQAPYDLGLVEELQLARDAFLDQVGTLPEVRPWPVAGTMYCLLDMSAWIGRTTPVGWVLESSGDLADYLLSEANVLVMPGDIVGHRGLLRCSFSHPLPELADAAGRIAWALGNLSAPG
ncbi:MAG: pyridoxal phosphate-dependent aminotransferase [Myxococcota bacterium]